MGEAVATLPAHRKTSFLSEYKGVKATTTALVLPKGLSFDDYQEIVRTLGAVASAVPFYIGDAMLEGEKLFNEAYAQVMNDTGLAYQTLANYVNVARWVEPDVRREELSHGHHAAVANMTTTKDGTKVPDKERQRYWLARAIEKDWSRGELREAIAADSQPGTGKDRENHDPASDLGPADQPAATGATEGGGSMRVGGTTSYDEERTQALLMALRDAYDSAMPVAALGDTRGYYAVPQDVMGEIADALGEEFTPEPYDSGDFKPPVVEGTARDASATAEVFFDDDAVPMVPLEQPGAVQGPVPHVDPPQPAQQTRSGVPVLDPSQVRIDGHPAGPSAGSGVPAGPETALPGGPIAVPDGNTFEGIDDL